MTCLMIYLKVFLSCYSFNYSDLISSSTLYFHVFFGLPLAVSTPISFCLSQGTIFKLFHYISKHTIISFFSLSFIYLESHTILAYFQPLSYLTTLFRLCILSCVALSDYSLQFFSSPSFCPIQHN